MRRNASANGTSFSHSSTPSASSSSYAGNSALADLLDDAEEEMECPLCLEEIDLSDLHFKPCPCGYQICRFCWHHIKENLNKRCPACRTIYTDEAVSFKPMKPDELKRLQAAKKQREKEKKESEILTASRKPLANVRVKHKSQVHIRGLTARTANEDTLNTLRDNEHYGKFGKITKIFLNRTTTPAGAHAHPNQQPVNLYINYLRSQDAAACISAIDGTYNVEGNELKAGWGTTKYCTAFLRGQKCFNENCQSAHELGEEVDINDRSARQELSSMKHAMKESETKRASTDGVKADAPGLPASASWASKNAAISQSRLNTAVAPAQSPISSPATSTPPITSPPTLQAPIGRGQRLPRPLQTSIPARPPGSRSRQSSTIKENGIAPERMDSLKVAEDFDSAASSDTEIAGPVASTSNAHSTAPIVEEVLPAFEDADFVLTPPPVGDDFDRTLDTFSSGSFSFTLRADIKGKERAPTDSVLKATTRPSPLSMRAALDQIKPDNSPVTPYSGAFDPFANAFDATAPTSADEADRRTSRFGFAKVQRMSSPSDAMFVDTSLTAARPLSSLSGPMSRHSSPASAADDLGAAAQLWASSRSPLSAYSTDGATSPANVALPLRGRISAGSAANMPLPPANSTAQQPLSRPPGLNSLSRSQGTAAAYALPPPPSAGPPGLSNSGRDMHSMISSPPPGFSGRAENPFQDPAIAQFGLSSANGQPASAAYHSLDHLRSPSEMGRSLPPAQHAYYR